MNQDEAKKEYEAFINKAKDDDRIIGIILTGGRGKGAATENSDYDVKLITTDDGFESVKREYPKTQYIDSLPQGISDFREHAKAGTETQWNQYSFTHLTALVDRTGEIQALIDEKGTLSSDVASKIASDALGGYLNSLHRSLKNARDGNMSASHLDAAESVPSILTLVFALEGRVRPYNKFLKWELENYPLKKLPASVPEFLSKIESIIQTGDVSIQKEILALIRTVADENGLTKELAEWEGYYFG